MDVDVGLEVSDTSVVKAGEWVLVVDNETRFSFAAALKEATVRLGKRACSCAPFIGASYGGYFEAINGKLIPTNPRDHQEALEDLLGDETEGTAGADNRHLNDHNTSQALTSEEIKAMQEEGKKAELVRKLAEGSATFTKRTEFSQEKYLRKKTQKHQIVVQILRPTAALISKAYFSKKSFRVQNLRPDTLAHIATLGNLHAGIRALVIDDCIGLIAGLALERAGGFGAIYNLHQGNDTNPSAIRLFNFTPDQLKALKHVPIGVLRGTVTAQTFKIDDSGADDQTMDVDPNEEEEDHTSKKAQKLARRIDPSELPPKRKKKDYVPLAKVLEKEAEEGITPEESAERRRKNNEARRLYRELKWQTLSDYKSELETRGVDSLLIVGPSHPINALNSTWRYLNLSGAFVIFSEFMQPLLECYEALYQTGTVINMRLTETWHRTYQVLPKRTHPLMNMSAASGYLLTGIKVEAAIPGSVAATEASSSSPIPQPPAKKSKR
jgi:tRNA (adenine-N(1)-)-methyltransferase non-catalytic subunit